MHVFRTYASAGRCLSRPHLSLISPLWPSFQLLFPWLPARGPGHVSQKFIPAWFVCMYVCDRCSHWVCVLHFQFINSILIMIASQPLRYCSFTFAANLPASQFQHNEAPVTFWKRPALQSMHPELDPNYATRRLSLRAYFSIHVQRQK